MLQHTKWSYTILHFNVCDNNLEKAQLWMNTYIWPYDVLWGAYKWSFFLCYVPSLATAVSQCIQYVLGIIQFCSLIERHLINQCPPLTCASMLMQVLPLPNSVNYSLDSGAPLWCVFTHTNCWLLCYQLAFTSMLFWRAHWTQGWSGHFCKSR